MSRRALPLPGAQPGDAASAEGEAPCPSRPGSARDTGRLQTLDAVRGAAVMGILLLNIVDFAMPGYAYVDPHFYGGADGANWWSWAIAYVLADGKMRGLFTMLFGASTVLIAERAVAAGKSAARIHYARMAGLLGIGMVHAYLIWSGDILVLYAIAGAAVFLLWRLPARSLLALAAILLAAKLAIGIADHAAARRLEQLAAMPDATPAVRAHWARFRAGLADSPADIPEQLATYRGGWSEVLPARIAETRLMQGLMLGDMLLDTIALMLIGMVLYRCGFFSGRWSRRAYLATAAGGYAVTIPLYLPIVAWIDATRFDPVVLMLAEPLHLVFLRPPMAVAHAAVVILFVKSGTARWLADRLAAAGRMAFSNYLLTSIVCTHLFCGYGLGWFGYLQRWQLYPVVLGIWALMLLWSKPWLERFAYGPFEWLWRSLSRGAWQPMRREPAND